MLANPVMLRAILVLVCAMSAFLLGLLFIRALRKNIAEESDVSGGGAISLETLPLHLYNTVIQQLKQQKHELQVQSQTEQHRARTSETFSLAVLSNLSCGVLVFGPNGLVKTSNPAAKAILGFASATGMGPEDIFRAAFVRSARLASSRVLAEENNNEADCILVADEISAVLREGSQRREVEAEYETPAGKKRFLAVTVSAVPAVDGGLLGVACLINDRTEVEEIRRQQELQGEISAEMALQLRTSLTTISGYAQQLANSRDPELAKQLATDIALESAQLDHSLGGFLTKKYAAQGAAVGNSRS
jgi:nitrogen fixation/metabolism regulation signal transduction histidine kinase